MRDTAPACCQESQNKNDRHHPYRSTMRVVLVVNHPHWLFPMCYVSSETAPGLGIHWLQMRDDDLVPWSVIGWTKGIWIVL